MLKSFRESVCFTRLDPEIQRKIDRDNLRFCGMMSVCVMVLETLVLIRYGLFGNRSYVWYSIRLWCYLSYFSLSALCYVLVRFVLKRAHSHKLLMAVGLTYCLASMVWGMLISAIDYREGLQSFVFITNVVCVAGLALIRPSVSIPLFSGVFAMFYWVLVTFCGVAKEFPTNYFILLLMVILISITRYHTKLSDSTARVNYEKLNRKLQRMSLYDELTDAKNRHSLALDMPDFVGRDLFFLLIDIDRFKDCNDTFGHPYGDRLLAQVADALQDHFPCEGVYRYGGDEFFVVAEEASSETSAERVARFQDALAALSGDGSQPSITVSGGCLHARPESLEDVNSLIRRIDFLLYEAKRTGRNRILSATL